MRALCFCIFLSLLGTSGVFAQSSPTHEWNRVTVEPMKTSIYVGSVKLLTTPFVRDGDHYRATYQAKVFPWAFWNENGKILITLSDADRAKLQRGERCEFTGEAFNQKNKPRKITGYADPAQSNTGKIKVRIGVDDIELVFNGPYTLSVATDDQLSSAQ